MLSPILQCHTNAIHHSGNYLFLYMGLYLTLIEPMRHQIRQSLLKDDYTAFDRLIPVALASETPESDYYTLLGVDKKATKQEIQKAFRRLAKKYHPDKNKDKNAQDEFIKIVKAYETLSDETKRNEYDNKSNMPGGQQAWASAKTSFNTHDFDINEFFRQYEDQFHMHAQHHDHHDHDAHHYNNHYQQHRQHHRASFGGIDLGDLFHNLDDDEWQSFGNFFGTHDNYHHHHHQHIAHQFTDDISSAFFGDGASFFGNIGELHSAAQHAGGHHPHVTIQSPGHSCRTITRKVNGATMTQTQCS